MFKLKFVFVFLFVSIAFYFSLFSSSFADQYLTRQITNTPSADTSPSLSNGQICWRSNADGDYDIYQWDGTSITNVSNNSADDSMPSLYNGEIAWRSNVDGDYDIYYWDGTSVSNVSNNSAADTSPSLSNGQIAWSSNADSNYDIYYWDGSSTTNVSNNTTSNSNPSLSNEQIAWQTEVYSNTNIAFWDGSSVTYITYNSNYVDARPSLSDGEIAWQNNMKYPGYSSSNLEIYFWDGSSITDITNRAENRIDYYPSLSNGQIAWQKNGIGIQVWNGSSLFNIPTSSTDFVMDGGQVAWSDSSEIYLSKLASVWIAEALHKVNLTDFTEDEIMDLTDLYFDQTSAVVNGMTWSYVPGDLPGDTNGEIYEIGDSWVYAGVNYIKLGSGLASTGSVPEVPVPLALGLLPTGILFERLRKKIKRKFLS